MDDTNVFNNPNVKAMYSVLEDMKSPYDATRASAYGQVRTAYITLLRDDSVDFSQLDADDLYIMKQRAIRGDTESVAANFVYEAAGDALGVSQYALGYAENVAEIAELAVNPLARAQTASRLVEHHDAIIAGAAQTLQQVGEKATSVTEEPLANFNGHTMEQRLALAQQLESAGNGQIAAHAVLAKETTADLVTALSMVGGAAAGAGKIPPMGKILPPAQVFTTPEGLVVPVAEVIANQAVTKATPLAIPAAGIMPTLGSGRELRSAEPASPKPASPKIDNEALLKGVDAPSGSNVVLTVNIRGKESEMPFNQLSVVQPPNAPPYFVLRNEMPNEQGVVPYRRVSHEQILKMAVNENMLAPEGSVQQMLLKSVHKLASNQDSAISTLTPISTVTPSPATRASIFESYATNEIRYNSQSIPSLAPRDLLRVDVSGVESEQKFNQVALFQPTKGSPYFELRYEEPNAAGTRIVSIQTSPERALELIEQNTQSGTENLGWSMLRDTARNLAKDQVSSISPGSNSQTLADAINHLQNADAQAIVLSCIADNAARQELSQLNSITPE